MIVYQATKAGFSDDVLDDRIDSKIYEFFKKQLNRNTSFKEIASWKNSMQYMDRVLNDSAIPDDCGIAIEYQLPQSAKRVDFIITGQDENNNEYAILIELKQWSDATLSDKDGIVNTFVGSRVGEHTHPSYQAWSYASLLQNFNETITEENIQLLPCAYLHNYVADEVMTHDHYKEYLEKAPVFLKGEAVKLRSYIKQFLKSGDKSNILYRIENGKMRPSKMLADNMASMMKGNKEFVMIDDQKIIYEAALALTAKASEKHKKVLIVKGGPGTGKSVVAINLLVEITKRGMLTQYISKNAAPRAVYENKLTDSLNKSVISSLFSGSGAFLGNDKQNAFDTLVIDEAHRLNEKSGLYGNLGENQVKELINASKCSVFFIDEDQRVTLSDIGTLDEIRKWASYFDAEVVEMELSSQFRCNGSDGYLAWLDHMLQIRETANAKLDIQDYDFKIFNDPNNLRKAIESKNQLNNKSRMVAGYCWKWNSKKDSKQYDVIIPEHNFKMKWNLSTDGSLYIVRPDSINEIGCIHTCQGLELDYVGVIIGKDMIFDHGLVLTQPSERASSDRSVLGYKKLLKEHPQDGKARLTTIIKNTYRTLMTRGMKGCYVYFEDKQLEKWFAENLMGH